ncbi:MAG: NYN domain-containing protein, partial [Gemmatimonadaceae bacterium]|nr:NYN domain-containing protein [Gemmatimonadaceae bacterium]
MHRGPQAHATPSSSPAIAFQGFPGGFAAPFHAPNAALLIDFDNVTMGIRSDLGNELRTLLGSDIIKGKVAVQRAYADWRRYPQYIVPLAESSIDMIMAPAYGSSKKNATDIRLAVDAMELVFTRPEIGTYILLSGDSDFASLVTKLKEYGKYVIGVGIRESSSDLLVMNCDEYYSYNALAGLVKSSEEEAVAKDPWELVTEAIQRMQRNGDVMRSDRLKQVMQEIDANFDESELGFSKFSKFTMEAAQKGLLTVTRLENGQLEVGLPEGRPAATRPAPTRAERSERPQAERTEGEGEEERGRGRRGRRGRGGRGREGREERPSTEVAAQVDREAEALTPVDAEAPEGREQPHEEQVQRVVVSDAVGQSGERLTRDEAFDLVRRAVE